MCFFLEKTVYFSVFKVQCVYSIWSRAGTFTFSFSLFCNKVQAFSKNQVGVSCEYNLQEFLFPGTVSHSRSSTRTYARACNAHTHTHECAHTHSCIYERSYYCPLTPCPLNLNNVLLHLDS